MSTAPGPCSAPVKSSAIFYANLCVGLGQAAMHRTNVKVPREMQQTLESNREFSFLSCLLWCNSMPHTGKIYYNVFFRKKGITFSLTLSTYSTDFKTGQVKTKDLRHQKVLDQFEGNAKYI